MAALDAVVAQAADLGVDLGHLAVGGDSAGGNLAAVAALHARDAGIPLRLQLLIYPAVAGAERRVRVTDRERHRLHARHRDRSSGS